MRARLLVLTLCFGAALPSFASITGTLMNNDGQPVGGARVSMYALETADARRARLFSDKPDRVPLAAVQSDAKGKFVFDSPKDAVVEIVVIATGYAPDAIRAERDDELGAIPLTSAEVKSGRITAGGKGVAGARVLWTGGGEVIATTDETGAYSVADPAKWANRVQVVHRDYAPLEEFTRRGIPAGATSTNRSLEPGVALKGRVLGEDGKPAAGVAVTVDGWPIATTADDGSFTAPHAPAKWQMIEARSGDRVGARARRADLTIPLAKAATVAGTVRDVKSLAPIAGADVTLRRDMRQGSTPTSALADAKGNFSISGLAPGSYMVVVNRPGYSFAPITIVAGVNDKASKTILGTHRGKVVGMVIDEEKRPVIGARLSSQAVSRETAMFLGPMMMAMDSRPSMSAPDGSFVLTVDSDADLQVEGRKKGLPSGRSATVRLAPGERKSGVLITIPGGLAVTGRVNERNGKPVAGVTVTAADARMEGPAAMARRVVLGAAMRGSDDELVRTANDGTFSMKLKEGSYDLLFRRDGFAPKTLRTQQINASTKPLEVTLDPAVEIAGRVTRGGSGVPGVQVNLMSEAMVGGNAETGPDGSFRIGDLAPGQFMLSVSKPDEFIQDFRTATAPASDITIEIPAGGRISGRVVDKTTKQPVTAFDAGVTVQRGGGGMIFMGAPQTRSFTSDDGTFVLENVPVGQTNLVVNAPGYTSSRLPLSVEEGKPIADLEVPMDHGVRVTGRVTGPGGSALAGVSVRLDFMAPGGGRVMRAPINNTMTATDENGDFTLEAMEPGEKTFNFSRSGYLTATKTATLSGDETRVDVQLSSGQRLTGVVVTEGGSPVADATVNAQTAAEGMGFRTTRTDANGTFQFEGLAPGRYTFSASKSGYADGVSRDVDITSGSVRVVLKTGATIYGRVIGLSPDEMTQATVIASNQNGNASSPVDAGGNYRIEGAPSGTVRVRATLMGMVTGGKSSPMVSVQVEPGNTIQQDIEFKSGTVVRGRVARDGRPVGGAMVMFAPRAGQAQTIARTQTDNSGNYEVSGLDDATYNVQVVDLGRGTPYTTTYDVRGSGTFNIDIKGARLRGRVVDGTTGQGIAEATVDLRERETGGVFRGGLATVQTDGAGSFVMESVPPGTYVIAAEKEGYGTKLVDLSVADSPADVEIKLTSQQGVTLKVVDARDGRLLSAYVRVFDAQNRSVFDSPFRMGGSAESMKLALEAGTYRATISAQGYASQTVTLISPSSPTIGLTPGGAILVHSKGSSLRRARLLGADGREYLRGGFMSIFTIDPSPGTTQLDNVAPGSYTLQILGNGEEVTGTTRVNVMEGQRAEVEI